jgi:hypothetical protein
MPKTDIGPKIGIEGEAQFKRQIKQINTEYKTLSTEVARVTSEFIGNEKSVEALTAVTNVLGAQEVELEKKQSLLREQLQKTADAYGVADERTQRLTQEYNKNEAQLNTLRAQIKSNEDEIQKLTEAENENAESSEKSTGLMDSLGLSVEKVGQKLGLSREQTNLLSEAFNGKGMSLAVAGAAAAAAVILVAKAAKEVSEFLVGAVNDARAFADEMGTLSEQTGFSTDFLQGLEYASAQVDVSTDAIVGSMRKLKKNLFSDSADVRAAFEQLNIIPEQLIQNQTPIEDVFRVVIGGLQHIDNELERDNVAMTLFGKSADDLAGVIDDGGEKLYGLIDGYKDLGYILSGDQLNALQQVDDAFNELDNEMKAVKNQIAAEMAPALLDLLTQLLEIAQSVDWKEFGKAAAEMLQELTPMIVDMAGAVAGLAGQLVALAQLAQTTKYSSSNDGVVMRNDGTIRNASAGYMASQPINVAVQLDSQTIARATYDANRAENNRIGNHAIR